MPIERRYIDACVLLAYLKEEVGRVDVIERILEQAQSGAVSLVTSVITIVEVRYAAEEVLQKKLSKRKSDTIARLWEPSTRIQLVEVSELIARDALALHRSNIPKAWTGIGVNDAIHLMTAKREKVSHLFTYSKDMKRYGPELGYEVCEPYFEDEAVEKDAAEEKSPLFESESDSQK